MTARTHCIYCNREITTRSREHVIHNALGGLYESTDICCPECNNYISRGIDVPFTKIFNPLIAHISNFNKTNNSNSTPPYTGTVSYNGNQYKASFKAGRVISCPDLARQLRCDVTKLPLKTVSYDFDLQNAAFKTGIAKIAFNYALDKGVDFDLLKHGLVIQKDGNTVTKLEYNYPLVPFYPLNTLDSYIELGTQPSLYHNMILFSQDNTLWCYIDLFNTFQYYVLLCDNLPADKNIYANYTQTLQKLDRTTPKLYIDGPKDIMIYAQQYGVEPTMEIPEFTRRITNAIARQTQRVPMQKFIGNKIATVSPFYSFQAMAQNPNAITSMMQSMNLYFDTDEECDEFGEPISGGEFFVQENFRTVTPSPDCQRIVSYPLELMAQINKNDTALRQYTAAKFNRLNAFLHQPTK